MDYQVAGLPLHILVVHFVAIVVPLAALCLVLSTAWPAARRRLGIVTPIIAFAALVSVPVATTQAGEWLAARVHQTALIDAHVAIGKSLLPWAFATFALAALQWAWFRYFAAPTSRYFVRVRSRAIRIGITSALAILVAVAAAGSVISVVVIGESGSRAVWTNSYTQNPR